LKTYNNFKEKDDAINDLAINCWLKKGEIKQCGEGIVMPTTSI